MSPTKTWEANFNTTQWCAGAAGHMLALSWTRSRFYNAINFAFGGGICL